MDTKTLSSIYRRMLPMASLMSAMAYGVVSLNFLVLPSIHARCSESCLMGTNFLTFKVKGAGETSDITVIVRISEEAHSDISLSFITGQRALYSIPGAFPVRNSTHSVKRYRKHGRLWTFLSAITF